MGKIKKDSLGDRMKQYEAVTEHYLVPKMPFIIRIDGKAFHTYTKGFKKPFDKIMGNTMLKTAKSLCEDIPGAVLGYTQSDEITILCIYTDRIKTQAWYNGRIEKINSIAASKATKYFNKYFREEVENNLLSISDNQLLRAYNRKIGEAEFDSRVFNIPEWDCINNIIWRQQDAVRNSVEAVGHAHFSAKELNKVNCESIKEKLIYQCGINWETDFNFYQKQGTVLYKVAETVEIKGNLVHRTKWHYDINEDFLVSNNREKFSKLTGLNEE